MNVLDCLSGTGWPKYRFRDILGRVRRIGN